MLDLKVIFDRYRIKWRDRGANVSRGNIVISCPWCNKTSNPDLGEHLAISTSGEYFCYRNQSHKGRSIPRLLTTLKVPSSEWANEKFTEFKDVRTERKDDKDFTLFRYFQDASKDPEALDYLRYRLFEDPATACKKFGLKVDHDNVQAGKWTGRLIIPMTVGWTARAMREHIEPRYDAYTNEDGFFLYRQGASSCIILEGAIDAMRVATVSKQFDVVGKCGGRLAAALINYLRGARYLSIYNIPDGDVLFNQYFEETKMLRSYITYSKVMQYNMPPDKKDFGLMTESIAREFLTHLC